MSVDPDDDLPVLTDVIVAGRPPRRLPDPPAARTPPAAAVTHDLADELTALAWDVSGPAPPAPHPGTPAPPPPDAGADAPDFAGAPGPRVQDFGDSFDRAFAAARQARAASAQPPPPAPHPGAWGEDAAAPLQALPPRSAHAAPAPDTELPDWLSLPVQDEPPADVPAPTHRTPTSPTPLPAASADLAAAGPGPVWAGASDGPRPAQPDLAPDPGPDSADEHRAGAAHTAPPGIAEMPGAVPPPEPTRPEPAQTAPAWAEQTGDAAGLTWAPGSADPADAPLAETRADPDAAPGAPAPALSAADLAGLAATLAARVDTQVDAAAKALRADLRAQIGAQLHALVSPAPAQAATHNRHADPDAPV